jgi:preprotein translocase subunit SecE
MANEPTQPKKRQLRQASQTVRERAERGAAKSASAPRPSRVRPAFRRLANLAIWKPVRYVGRFVIPPFIKSSWRELRQVTWPSRKQSRQLTSAVIIFAVVFGVIVSIFDFGLDKLFKQVIIRQ